MPPVDPPAAAPLPSLGADLSQCTVSGLSSGAFMAVQLHLAHSALFVGAGVIAGGPYRCAESYAGPSLTVADAWVQNALFICMNPLTDDTAPQAAQLARLARQAADDGLIDDLSNMARQRLYLFTGSEDKVVSPRVVEATRRFYQLLGVPEAHIHFDGGVPAGHAILTDRLEDNPEAANAPPYINRWRRAGMQSTEILAQLVPGLNPPAERAAGRLVRFDQREFSGGLGVSSMSAYGYAYLPPSVLAGGPCRVHVALHGCKQGYNYVNLDNGRPDRANDAPYGDRYMTTTGYNEVADTNALVVLYPQVEGIDDGRIQNPDGCWDWWGYSSAHPDRPDFHSKHAVQIRAIHEMLQRLGSH